MSEIEYAGPVAMEKAVEVFVLQAAAERRLPDEFLDLFGKKMETVGNLPPKSSSRQLRIWRGINEDYLS